MTGMARRIFGTALLTLRAAVRTGTFAAVFALLSVLILLLPRLLKGDGTIEGQASVLLTYTLGAVFVVLVLGTLWGGCSIFSQEISTSRLGLSWVKPITPFQMFVGKFLALMVINALALAYAGAVVFFQLPEGIAGTGATSGRCVSVSRPVMPSVREEALQAYEEMKKNGELPEGFSRRRIVNTLIRRTPDRYTAIVPGETVQWTFALPEAIEEGDSPALRMFFETEWNSRTLSDGRCRIAVEDETGASDEARELIVPMNRISRNTLLFELPEEKVLGVRKLKAVFEYDAGTNGVAIMLTRFRRDVSLIRTGSDFSVNLVKALLLQLGALGAVAALGLMLGAAFSFPVASFTGTLLLILFSVSGSVVKSVTEEETDTKLKRMGFAIAEQVDQTISSVINIDALDKLVDGEQIENKQLLLSVARSFILLPFGILGVLACIALKRRDKQGEA